MNRRYDEIMERGRRKWTVYASFLKSLRKKRIPQLDTLFIRANDSAFEQINCLSCGRCCTHLGPKLNDKDISRLSKNQRMKPVRFIESYLRRDEDGDMVFQSMPCVFLGADCLCLVYADRPYACRDYPHMDSGRQKNRIPMHIENLLHCPAVILATEYLYSAGM